MFDNKPFNINMHYELCTRTCNCVYVDTALFLLIYVFNFLDSVIGSRSYVITLKFKINNRID